MSSRPSCTTSRWSGAAPPTRCAPTPSTCERYVAHLRAAGVDDLAAVREEHVTGFVVVLRSPRTAGPRSPRRRRPGRSRPSAGCTGSPRATAWSPADVARAVAPPALPRRLPRTLSVDEVDQLLAGCPGDDPAALRDRALLELLYSTGARISEAVGIDLDDLDARARTVLLRGKGGKQRLVPVGRPGARGRRGLPGAGPARRWPPAAGARPALLLNARGARLSRQSAFHVLRAAAETAGVARDGLAAHAAALLRDPPARRAVRTCGWCRSCSATRRWRRPSSTPTSRSTRCARSTPRPTRAPWAERCDIRDVRTIRVNTCRSARRGALPLASAASYSHPSIPPGIARERPEPAWTRRGPSIPDRRMAPRTTPTSPQVGTPPDSRARTADRPRPRPRDRRGEPEGRRRQDDVDDQPRRGARRVRPQGAARRLRPAGRAVGRPRRAAPPARDHRSTTCSWSATPRSTR